MTGAAPNPFPPGLRLIAFDIDGVFTDGRFYLSDDGIESKSFSTQDGYGIRCLIREGIEVAVVSGRSSGAVERRMSELGVPHVFQGCKDKVATFGTLIGKLGIDAVDCAYVGDDVPDLLLMENVGFAVAVANAVDAVIRQSDYTTQASGGFGAVREVCDMLLAARTNN